VWFIRFAQLMEVHFGRVVQSSGESTIHLYTNEITVCISMFDRSCGTVALMVLGQFSDICRP
jgi:hypothetical protein